MDAELMTGGDLWRRSIAVLDFLGHRRGGVVTERVAELPAGAPVSDPFLGRADAEDPARSASGKSDLTIGVSLARSAGRAWTRWRRLGQGEK
jgi:hypothetical protein